MEWESARNFQPRDHLPFVVEDSRMTDFVQDHVVIVALRVKQGCAVQECLRLGNLTALQVQTRDSQVCSDLVIFGILSLSVIQRYFTQNRRRLLPLTLVLVDIGQVVSNCYILLL